MRHGHRLTLVAGTAIATVSLLSTAGAAGAASGAGASGAGAGAGGKTPAEVRVNQVGYTPGSPKVAYAMLPGRAGRIRFLVTSGHQVVFRGRSDRDLGGWNSAYRAVY